MGNNIFLEHFSGCKGRAEVCCIAIITLILDLRKAIRYNGMRLEMRYGNPWEIDSVQ